VYCRVRQFQPLDEGNVTTQTTWRAIRPH
jgi:hypothetical protein